MTDNTCESSASDKHWGQFIVVTFAAMIATMAKPNRPGCDNSGQSTENRQGIAKAVQTA